MEILEKIFQHQLVVCRCPSQGLLISPSLTINITGFVNIKITRDKKVPNSKDKFTAIYNSIDEINTDNKSIGGKFKQIFH